jgi:hypothetical protein
MASDEWISVKEKLPPKNKKVLVFAVTNIPERPQYRKKYVAIDMRKQYLEDDEAGQFITDLHFGEVTHWMPLPRFSDGTSYEAG